MRNMAMKDAAEEIVEMALESRVTKAMPFFNITQSLFFVILSHQVFVLFIHLCVDVRPRHHTKTTRHDWLDPDNWLLPDWTDMTLTVTVTVTVTLTALTQTSD